MLRLAWKLSPKCAHEVFDLLCNAAQASLDLPVRLSFAAGSLVAAPTHDLYLRVDLR